MTLNEVVKTLQRILNKHGAKLVVDGDYGPKTAAAVKAELGEDAAPAKPAPTPNEPSKAPPWYTFAKKFNGKSETDPAFNKEMSAKWSLVGLNLGTIAKNWAAWCGLAMAVSLAGVGISYQKDGAAARNWAKYGVGINWKEDGVPRGAILHINGAGNCNSAANNHVTQANGDCSPADLLKDKATIDGYGGNQGDTWKTSTYPVRNLCAVRWPADYPRPGKITKSVNCTAGGSSGESTR